MIKNSSVKRLDIFRYIFELTLIIIKFCLILYLNTIDCYGNLIRTKPENMEILFIDKISSQIRRFVASFPSTVLFTWLPKILLIFVGLTPPSVYTSQARELSSQSEPAYFCGE